jgi:hypothetical protein
MHQRYLLEESKRLREEARGGTPASAAGQAGKAGGAGAAGQPAERSKGRATRSGGTTAAVTKKKGTKAGGVAVKQRSGSPKRLRTLKAQPGGGAVRSGGSPGIV